MASGSCSSGVQSPSAFFVFQIRRPPVPPSTGSTPPLTRFDPASDLSTKLASGELPPAGLQCPSPTSARWGDAPMYPTARDGEHFLALRHLIEPRRAPSPTSPPPASADRDNASPVWIRARGPTHLPHARLPTGIQLRHQKSIHALPLSPSSVGVQQKEPR